MKHHHIGFALIIASLVAGVSLAGFAAEQSVVRAGDNVISVTVGYDACDNIPGVQSAVPDGMIRDSSGNCYTPPPAPVDVCNNLDGNQESIPDGYYRDDAGACHRQPTPPAPAVDVCPNLDGLQTSVPAGYVNDTNGDCVLPPVDQCSNIDGVQSRVPDGMTRDDDGMCQTPPSQALSPTAPTSPSEPRQPQPTGPGERPVLTNVPDAVAPLIQPLVDIVPDAVKQAVRALPPVVAQTFPYFIFIVLGVSAGILWLQATREAIMASRFVALLKRERSIAEQKDNFIALASHYLRTPQTVMSNGLDAVIALGELSTEQVGKLQTHLQTLHDDIEAILADVQSNEALKSVKTPTEATEAHSFLRSWHFWLPIAISIGLTLLANFLLGVVGEVELGTLNLVAQVLIFMMVIFFFYSAFRNHRTRKRNRAQQESLVSHERAVDDARNAFLQQATGTLSRALNDLYTERVNLPPSEHITFFDDGYTRFLAILNKFTLLSKIRTGQAASMESINLQPLASEIIKRHAETASEKNITITNSLPDITITQQRELVDFVLDSLIDNAIKFSSDNGTVNIAATPDQHKLSISITDTGSGIALDKQSQLFQPFSRTESAVEFNYEGLGFSLFLDRIIMDYLEGEISVNSDESKGSTFTITTSQHKQSSPSTTPVAV